MNLSEALVSYNQVRSPEIPVSVATPDEDTQYKRYLKYIEDLRKKSKSSKTDDQTISTQQSSGWEGWTLSDPDNEKARAWWYISDKATVDALIKELKESEITTIPENPTPENTTPQNTTPQTPNPDNVKRAKKASKKSSSKYDNDAEFNQWSFDGFSLDGLNSNPINYEFRNKNIRGFNLGKDIDRFKYWMHRFSKFGLDVNQQFVLTLMMKEECDLRPKGTVNKHELKGKSDNKATHGWANAGEGNVQFTTWATKSELIKMYNKSNLREGPPLTLDKNEYSKNETRHIVDLSDNDLALMTYLFYNNLYNSKVIDKTKNKNMPLEELAATFYLHKAGQGKGRGHLPLLERAYRRGEDYRQFNGGDNKWEVAMKTAGPLIQELLS